MTADEFRALALSFEGAAEGEHMKHPDFRTHGKIFATLGYPDDAYGMVKLTQPDQAYFLEKFPRIFSPVKGAWGLQGSTSVLLSAVQHETLAQAMELAWKSAVVAPEPKKWASKSAASKTSAKK